MPQEEPSSSTPERQNSTQITFPATTSIDELRRAVQIHLLSLHAGQWGKAFTIKGEGSNLPAAVDFLTRHILDVMALLPVKYPGESLTRM